MQDKVLLVMEKEDSCGWFGAGPP